MFLIMGMQDLYHQPYSIRFTPKAGWKETLTTQPNSGQSRAYKPRTGMFDTVAVIRRIGCGCFPLLLLSNYKGFAVASC